MGHVLPRAGAVPVALAGGDEREVAGRDLVLLALGRDDPLARGDEEHLIRLVGVELVPRAVSEGDLVEPERRARLTERILRLDLADEDLAGVRLPSGGPDPNDAHAQMMPQTGPGRAPRG